MDRARGLRSGVALKTYLAMAVAACFALCDAAGAELRAAGTTTWILETSGLQGSPGAQELPAAVGSLQKPFVAEAWARTHADQESPRFNCGGGASCWLKPGHGTLGLARATALSCNGYFRQLAAGVPPENLASTFREAGFRVAGSLSPEAAIGLDTPPGIVTVTPEALLRAYVRLTRVPWASGEAVRREVLSGMRASALDGTAKALAHRGYWAKTGTVGRPGSVGTLGWALAVDDSGWAMLARAEPATGREAAAVLGDSLAKERPWSVQSVIDPPGRRGTPSAGIGPAPEATAKHTGRVRVALFERLGPRSIRVRNLGPSPTSSAAGFVGPGATVSLRAGDRVSESIWEIRVPEVGLLRVVRAALCARRGDDRALTVVAEMDRREYVSGVIAAELLEADTERRVGLGAAVLRFLARGPRHGDADVCDSTHCAFFIGRGPRVVWTRPQRALLAGSALAPIDEGPWARIQAAAAAPGPDQWTSHCGGRPLSAHAVWGNGDRAVHACPFHGPAHARNWTRTWSTGELTRAFGASLRSMRVRSDDGIWGLEVETDQDGPRLLRYDEAHRVLAAVLGWGSLPSPAEQAFPSAGGWRAEGVGLGHRVGLCLGPKHRSLALFPHPTGSAGR